MSVPLPPWETFENLARARVGFRDWGQLNLPGNPGRQMAGGRGPERGKSNPRLQGGDGLAQLYLQVQTQAESPQADVGRSWQLWALWA